MKKIASVGSIYLDINAPDFPIPHPVGALVGTETMGKEYEIVLGGSAVNFARFCKQLGLEALFIGKTGKDVFRSILLEKFKTEDIAPALSQDPAKQTNMNTNLVSPTNESIMLSFGNANQSLALRDVLGQLEQHKDDFDFLYLGGVFKLKFLMPSLLDVVATVKSQNKTVILDHGRVVNTATNKEKDEMKKIVKTVDIYLPSRDEFLQLWNVGSIEEGLQLLCHSEQSEEHFPLVVVKDGENGAYTLQNNEIIHVPAFFIKPFNTIGAGDVFNAGLITALSESKSVVDAIRFANAIAALKISQSNFPTRGEIEKLLNKS